jgi:radical SAM protein with 4Fe4S-binding SPASM domain
LDDWARVFVDAEALGTEYLDISGGEPTLYRALPGLVWEGKRHGWYVSINSTGFHLPEMIDRLLEVCLDQVIVSLVSIDPDKHDAIRRTAGSWQAAKRAIDLIRGTPLRLILHFIVGRENFRELPDLVDFAFDCEANGISLVYPENDHARRFLLMSSDDIVEFRRSVLPECLLRYRKYHPTPHESHQNLAGFLGAHGVEGDFSQGLYWRDFDRIFRKCDKPETFALIYANGNVMPCNAMEYTHTPIVGNVLRQNLREIWAGEAYCHFRERRTPFCRQCPIQRHTGIAIRTRDNPPYAAPVIRSVPRTLPSTRPDIQ